MYNIYYICIINIIYIYVCIVIYTTYIVLYYYTYVMYYITLTVYTLLSCNLLNVYKKITTAINNLCSANLSESSGYNICTYIYHINYGILLD